MGRRTSIPGVISKTDTDSEEAPEAQRHGALYLLVQSPAGTSGDDVDCCNGAWALRSCA